MGDLVNCDEVFVCFLFLGGYFGGVVCVICEFMIVMEVVGYNVVFVEIVGVGQFEVVVVGMVDIFFMFLVVGIGDQFQGIKKGILELVDVVVVNKVDGDNVGNV